MIYCGIDEAGRGSVMGPMVVGILRTASDEGLLSLGVKDSKKLSPKRREIIYDELISSFDCHIVEVSASEIDELRKIKSLNEIELDMFCEAFNELPAEVAYVDCPDINEKRFAASMSKRCAGRVVAEHGADDRYPATSAASVIAKVTRDRRMSEISEELGENVGSGYPSDRVTMSFIEKWIKHNGRAPLDTRCSWEPVKRMMSLAVNMKLDDYW